MPTTASQLSKMGATAGLSSSAPHAPARQWFRTVGQANRGTQKIAHFELLIDRATPTSRLSIFFVSLTLAIVAIHFTATAKAADPTKLPLVFEDNFEQGTDHWQPGNPAVWKVIDVAGGKAYSLFEKDMKFKTAHRSPFTYSLVKDITVGDFAMEVDGNSTVAEYAHRDLCFFFGFQDPDHYYYVHLASRTDDHANNIFIVNGKDREKISTKTTPGTNWTDTYHHVKVTRTVADGATAIYFDDMESPVMTAADTTFAWGRVGIGSFDDTGDFRNFKLCGVKVEQK